MTDILNFKTDNIWCTKWSVYNYDNTKIEYKNTFTGGEIISNVKNANYSQEDIDFMWIICYQLLLANHVKP